MSAFDAAWSVLKALPEQQAVSLGGVNLGTVHPSVLGLMSRLQSGGKPVRYVNDMPLAFGRQDTRGMLDAHGFFPIPEYMLASNMVDEDGSHDWGEAPFFPEGWDWKAGDNSYSEQRRRGSVFDDRFEGLASEIPPGYLDPNNVRLRQLEAEGFRELGEALRRLE